MNAVFLLPETEDREPARSRRRSRRQRRARGPQDGELNIVSMIDVFAVLVFFLLVGSSISVGKLHAVNLDVGGGEQATGTEQDKPLELTVVLRQQSLSVSDASGTRSVLANLDGEYDLAGLAALLEETKSAHPQERAITLRMEPQISYEKVVQVMDVARDGSQGSGELFPMIRFGDASIAGVQK